MIRDTGIPNFLGLHIPVKTNLNIASWRKHLVDYFEQQLPDLIEFRFPLDFDRARDLQSTLVNHASARMYPEHVDKYIQEEVWLLAAIYNINVIVTHIRGHDNSVVDLLSRWYQTSDNHHKLYEFIELPIWVDVNLDHDI